MTLLFDSNWNEFKKIVDERNEGVILFGASSCADRLLPESVKLSFL